MRPNKPIMLVVALLALAALACGGSTEEFVIVTSEEPTAAPPTVAPQPTEAVQPEAGAGDKGTERGSIGGSSNLPTPSASGSLNPGAGPETLLGNYTLTGTQADGSGSYTGTATISANGDVFQISWNIGDTITTGQGIFLSNVLSVAYPTPGCSVSAYDVLPDGTLDGLWVLEEDGTNPERATPNSDPVGLLASNFTVTGTNPDGTQYTGEMNLFPGLEPPVFSFVQVFTEGGETIRFDGVSVLQADVLAASYASSGDCGVVNYLVNGDGTLSGLWGDTIVSTQGAGTEILTPGG